MIGYFIPMGKGHSKAPTNIRLNMRHLTNFFSKPHATCPRWPSSDTECVDIDMHDNYGVNMTNLIPVAQQGVGVGGRGPGNPPGHRDFLPS